MKLEQLELEVINYLLLRRIGTGTGGDITSCLLNIRHEKLSGRCQSFSLRLFGGTNKIYFD